MKKTLKGIWGFFVALGEAKYAADLARNGKWQEAQDLYRK